MDPLRTIYFIYYIGKALIEVLVERLVKRLVKRLVEHLVELLQSFCRALYGSSCRASVELRAEFR